MENSTKIEYMKIAFDEAKVAFDEGEIPVGAVIVADDRVLSVAHNNRERTGDATGHAEIIAIREACQALGGWHLDKCTLYVTLEPCPMCMGAIVNSRIKKVVFGAKDAKAGACGSVMNISSYPLNHKPEIESGFMKDECAALLSDFFKSRRI
jgi:tRNA(adenine34) deaminase